MSLIDMFLAEHADVKPDAVWTGEIHYVHTLKVLGLPFGSKRRRRRKATLFGWRLEHINGRAWILEDGGIAVQTGPFGPDLSVPVGWLLSPDQSVHYIDRRGNIDENYRQALIKALYRS
ncbi:MAG: hypothetical protein ACOH18_00535 [Candidatus Saccharimonadaceae bacterium]